jgi:mycothiol synthase
MIDIQIRKFTSDDYQTVVDIHNTLHVDRPEKAANLMESDEKRDAQYKHQRFLAEKNGQVVGTGTYYQSAYQYHPQKFGFTINVLPEYQRQGIGSTLYDHIVDELQPFDPINLKTSAYENPAGGIPFLEKLGFVEVFRERKSELDLTTFEPLEHDGFQEKLIGEGIEFLTLKEAESDPACNPALYELERDLILDIPGVTEDNFSWPDYDKWEKDRFDMQPESYFVARYQGEYIGLSFMNLDKDSNAAYQWLTGVKGSFRRRGIGLALKVIGISYAKENGYPVIRTSSAVTNEPILALSSQLGYKPLSEWVDMEKTL